MPVIGITGGVASGKSRAVESLQGFFGDAAWFSADQAVANLLRDDPTVAEAAIRLFGPQALTPNGVDKHYVRKKIFEEPLLRLEWSALLHPPIRAQWTSAAQTVRESKGWFFAEIPLLYETGGQSECDQVVVVACSIQTQIRRMTLERDLPEAVALQILEAQWPAERKVALGDFLLWNDSSLPCLHRQAELLASWLHHTYA